MSEGLAAAGIHKTYQIGSARIRVLAGVDVAPVLGAVTVVQGASGSGKSTLLHVLGGLDRPSMGEVTWNGQSVYGWPRATLASWRNLHIGFVFQSFHLLPELTALENVEMPAMLARRPAIGASRKLLDAVGLGDRVHHLPTQLSGGEQQRVAIARSLRNDPSILLADEPTGNLDPATGRDVINILLQMQKERKKTLIVVTHDDTVAGLGEFRLRLADGRLSPVS
jgi:putative ABC transport system ATP-binding protein/lipoprotein-releasing system ATP-binding protein